jgi:hypothetical protein
VSAVSAAAVPPGSSQPAGAAPPQTVEGYPLCGTPLRAEQEWCLRCGAAASTRLASTPNWRAPLIALALAIVIALGALTASLVKLAGGPRTTPATTITRTVTAPTDTVPDASTPGAVTPGASTPGTSSLGGTVPSTPATTPKTTTSGAATTPHATTTTPAGGALLPGTKIRVPGATSRQASKLLSLLSPHSKR